MAKKNRNSRAQQKQATLKKQVITQAMLKDANEALVKSEEALKSVLPEEVNVSEIESTYITDGTMTSEDVAKCVTELKRSTTILNATKNKYEELKSQLIDEKKQWRIDKEQEDKKLQDDKKSAEAEREKANREIAEKRKELNERELKLVKEASAAQTGDHSAVMERLLTVFRKSREEVISVAEAQIKEQEEVAKEYFKKLDDLTIKELQLEKKDKELRSREKKTIIIEEDFQEERETMRLEIEAEIKNRYEDDLNIANRDANLYRSKFEKSREEIKKLRNSLETIQAVFGDENPEDMAKICTKQGLEIEDLKRQLDERPLPEDLSAKQKEIDYLQLKLIESDERLNEKEYLELKKMFDNNDVLLRDKQLLLDKIESAKVRETNLLDTVEDLRRTIREINETHNKENAFKSSSKYDLGDYQVPLSRGKCPENLSEFISYLQSFMASGQNGEKELRYSKDTIKKFIAGLHMSPISILQGISGTGKTSLPRAVALAMMADDQRYNGDNGDDELPKAPYRICPIQSGWRDKMDLFGFYNSFEKSYHETEFFNALYLANQPKYTHTMFFIVLDEMNLSRPEHYFADFLSKLEQPEGQRKVKIDNVPDDICPKSILGGTLSIPGNVRFIGTANHDETTLEFAPKTYDRSNVIDMPRNCHSGQIPKLNRRYNVTYEWLHQQFSEAEQKHVQDYAVFDRFIKDKDLTDLLAERDIGVGNRFEGQAQRFLSVFVEAGVDIKSDIAKAADHLMTTRLLRTLKDNYDLTYDILDQFKENYRSVFSKYFDKEPQEAIELFERELEKKKG